MTVIIPPDMSHPMDLHAEDKLTAWNFFKGWIKLYFSIAHRLGETKVDSILFFHGKATLTSIVKLL